MREEDYAFSSEQVAQYFREGYIVLRDLVPQKSVERVLEVAPTSGVNGRWTPVVFDHKAPNLEIALHSLLVEPNVIAVAERIFEAPARVFYGMLAVVPANGGHGLPWHQDNQYTQILGNALNIFIALCDITPEMANLWVAPKSHLRGVQPSKTNATNAPGHREAEIEPENGVPLGGLMKGDVCIFDRHTYHRTLQNTTDRTRYAYAAQYMAEYARMAVTGEKDALRMRASDLRKQWLDIGGTSELR